MNKKICLYKDEILVLLIKEFVIETVSNKVENLKIITLLIIIQKL